MIVGTVKETFPGERRVAIAPHVLPLLTKAGCEVLVEADAGLEAGFTDAAFTEKGAKVVASRKEVFDSAEILLQVPERLHGSLEIPGCIQNHLLWCLIEGPLKSQEPKPHLFPPEPEQ